jgi:hypothetical protein
MKRRAQGQVFLALAAIATAIAAPALAGTSVSVQFSTGNAPPPPVVRYRTEPAVVMVPGSSVWIVNDNTRGYDYFRCGVYWYIWSENTWYRSRAYNGPFTAIDVKYVPAAVFDVPARHWKHHPHGGPPGLMKKRGMDRDRQWSDREDDDRGRGRGRGRGHGD